MAPSTAAPAVAPIDAAPLGQCPHSELLRLWLRPALLHLINGLILSCSGCGSDPRCSTGPMASFSAAPAVTPIHAAPFSQWPHSELHQLWPRPTPVHLISGLSPSCSGCCSDPRCSAWSMASLCPAPIPAPIHAAPLGQWPHSALLRPRPRPALLRLINGLALPCSDPGPDPRCST